MEIRDGVIEMSINRYFKQKRNDMESLINYYIGEKEAIEWLSAGELNDIDIDMYLWFFEDGHTEIGGYSCDHVYQPMLSVITPWWDDEIREKDMPSIIRELRQRLMVAYTQWEFRERLDICNESMSLKRMSFAKTKHPTEYMQRQHRESLAGDEEEIARILDEY